MPAARARHRCNETFTQVMVHARATQMPEPRWEGSRSMPKLGRTTLKPRCWTKLTRRRCLAAAVARLRGTARLQLSQRRVCAARLSPIQSDCASMCLKTDLCNLRSHTDVSVVATDPGAFVLEQQLAKGQGSETFAARFGLGAWCYRRCAIPRVRQQTRATRDPSSRHAGAAPARNL